MLRRAKSGLICHIYDHINQTAISFQPHFQYLALKVSHVQYPMYMLRFFKNGRSGKYYAQYTRADGSRRQFSCKTANLRRAEEIASLVLKEKEDQRSKELLASCSMSDFERRYLSSLAKHLSPKTISTYRDSFSQFRSYLPNVQLSDVSVAHCYEFLYAHQPSTQTAARHYRQLRRAFKLAKSWKLIETNPFDEVDSPKPIQRKKDILTENEFTILAKHLVTNTYADRRLKRIIMIARLTGARAGEIFNIQTEQILHEKEMLLIINSDSFRTKSGKNRFIPLSRIALEIINDQVQDNHTHQLSAVRESPYLFPNERGTPLSIFTISPLFKKIARELFPHKARLCFHSLRGTFITHAVDDGVPLTQIQIAVGHSSIKTTEQYINYDNVKLSALQKSLNLISIL